jgi:Periplasmic copper-binding protein (NosD)
MRSLKAGLITGSLLTPLLVAGALLAQAGPAVANTSHHQGAVFVSPNASPSGSGQSCSSAKYSTIQAGVNAAPAWSTVVVCPGTYHEQVVVKKPLSLVGLHATINEQGVTPTLVVKVPHVGKLTIFAAVVILSSHVHFQGFKVTNALGEGILAAGVRGDISNVTIQHNAVVHNDLGGGVPPASTYFECQPAGPIPGDCGEGVHFIAVADSAVNGNFIAHNSGGVLLTDETGPTHNNVIENNIVTENESDCGITVPGHNPMALNSAGQPQPSVAGVYDNVIVHNVVTNNGLKGEGAGVLFANASAGTASYNNLVIDNFIAGNGLSGVTMHAHTIMPGQFELLSGNKIIGNRIGRNNIDGDTLDFPASPKDERTTGVLVFSGGTPVTVVIAHNHIFDNFFGIWLSKPVTAFGLGTNTFHHVTVPVSSGH